jgi:hypothetical protein
MSETYSGGLAANKFGPVNGKWQMDVRISWTLLYFDNQDDADLVAKQVKKAKCKRNGGWFDGMQCGREEAHDYQDRDGMRWYAVSC